MAFLWSDPTPSNATSAALSSPFHIEAANVGQVLGALLSYQRAKQQEKDKQYADMINGIAKGVSGAYGQYQQGQADDAANAAIYGMQNPQDQYGGFQNSDVVPDYGGTDALRAMDYAHKAGGFQNPYDVAYDKARVDAMQALAHNRWTYPNGASGDSMTPRQEITTANDALKAARDQLGQYDNLPDEVISNPDSRNIHGPNDTPAVYSDKAPPTTVPKDQLLIVDPKTGQYQYVTPDYLNEARRALDAYKHAQGSYNSLLNVPSAVNASPGVRQSDVDQANQATSGDQAQSVLLQQAKDAISRGADPAKVAERLKTYGITVSPTDLQ